MSSLFWKRFLVDAGIPVRAADSYTTAFVENRITESMVSDLNKNILVDLGITIIGDVIAILKHAIRITEEQSSEQKRKTKEKQKSEQKKKSPPPPKPESEKKAKKVIKKIEPIEAPEKKETKKMVATVRKPTVVKGEKRAPVSEEITTTKRPKETVIRRVIPSEQTVRCVSPDSTTSHRMGTTKITLNRVIRNDDDDDVTDIKVEKKRKVISWSPERTSTTQKVRFHTTMSSDSKPTTKPIIQQQPSTLRADRLATARSIRLAKPTQQAPSTLRADRLESTNPRTASVAATTLRADRLATARSIKLATTSADRLDASASLRADRIGNSNQTRVVRTQKNIRTSHSTSGRPSDSANSFRR
eukprot:sb/3466055/